MRKRRLPSFSQVHRLPSPLSCGAEREQPYAAGDENRNSSVAAPRLLTVGEVADRAGLSNTMIRRELRLRRLAFYKLGHAVRIGEDDLEAYLAKRRHHAR